MTQDCVGGGGMEEEEVVDAAVIVVGPAETDGSGAGDELKLSSYNFIHLLTDSDCATGARGGNLGALLL